MSRKTTKTMNNWKIDGRNSADIEKRIKELAASYAPEWHFDEENPDIGSAIGKIFARQTETNIHKYNQVLEKYHTEFVNMLGISLHPAKPSMATVLLETSQDTIPGVEVYKGTKLLAESEGGEDEKIFETLHNLYVTSANLEYMFMTQQEDGKIIPLKGEFVKTPLVDGVVQEEDEEEEADAEALEEDDNSLKPFRLFASKEAGIQQNALLFYHSTIFNIEDNQIYIKLEGSQTLLEKIQTGAFRFWYFTKDGMLPVEECQVLLEEETIVLNKKKECAVVELEGKQYSLIALMTKEPVKEAITLSDATLSSSGKPATLEAANNGMTDFDSLDFNPFTDTLSLFLDCYLGHDAYFSKAGSKIRLEFDVSYEENRILNEPLEEDNSLKIIKKKPRTIPVDAPSDTRADEISVEYFNGIGWKKLNCEQDTKKMFAEDHPGKYKLSFICPDDWEETSAGAYQGRCIRMQLLKADNCYARPCIHHYPRIRNMQVSFTYEEAYMEPQKLFCVAGTKKYDLTKQLKEGEKFTAFSGSGYEEDALYLGFRRKLENGPVSLLFQMDDEKRFEGTKCKFEYSTAKGFKQMKIQDHTSDMSRSGTVLFLPQTDMQPVMLEGKNIYWIRISRSENSEKAREDLLPIIKDIRFNAVMVANVETNPEENYYLDEVKPNMTVNLGVNNILDIELWVNEKSRFSRPQMLKMLQDMPKDVRVEEDLFGEISAFYIRWQEVDQLDDPVTRRCYVLDRMNNLLIFGDGIHTEIPREQGDIAFKARIRCCDGAEGNVSAGMINDSMDNLMFIDMIYNPVKAYGGSSMESIENALMRGANILKSRRRLVSMDDYEQEILSFSDSIDQVKCVVGETVTGKKIDNALTFAILLKDFQSGSYSFHNVSGNLKKHLLESCELTVTSSNISIVEPIFVKVSVDVWAQIPQMDDSFEVQNLLRESLENYLNPVSDEKHSGWEIGTLPKKSQLLMRLNMLKSKAIIKKMVATVKYTDHTGTYEADLEDIQGNPFMICCSGEHRVNVMVSKE